MAITLDPGTGGADLHTVTDAASGDEVQVIAVQDEGGDEWVISAAGAGSVEVTAALPTGANTIGDVTVSGDALTALQLIDNIVVVEDAVHASGASGVMALAVRNDTLAALAGTDGDYAPIQVNASGAVFVQEGAAMDVSAATVTVTDDGSFTLAANSGVDIGDVDVLSVIPGTGATNLGKAIDAVVGGTDTGVALLAKHQEDQVHLTTADGDYDVLTLDSLGSLHVNAEAHHILDAMNATTGWAAFDTDTANLATTTKHVLGTNALSFDKVDTAANATTCGIQKTLTTVDLGDVSPHDIIQTSLYLSSVADVAHVFVRLGTDSSNYNEWRIADDVLTAGQFDVLAFTVGDASHTGITGNGWDPSAVAYAAVGVEFDAQGNTLSGIIYDQISYHTNQHTVAQLNAEVSSSVSSPNVRLNGYGGSTDVSTGNASANTLRVVLATDQPSVQVDLEGGAVVGTDGSAGPANAISIAGTESGGTLQELRVDSDGHAQVDVLGTVTVDLSTNNDVQGAVAADAAVSGNPFLAGARASNSIEGITQVANGDAVYAAADLNGVLVSRPHTTPEEHISERVSNTNGTSTAFTNFAAGGAGIHNYVTDVTVYNSSATAGYVDFRDGTAGSIIWTFPLPATGGATHSFSLPLKGAANTALAYDVSAALTTVYISVNGFQAQG